MINKKKIPKISLKYLLSYFLGTLKNGFESATVNAPLVFESSKFYCIHVISECHTEASKISYTVLWSITLIRNPLREPLSKFYTYRLSGITVGRGGFILQGYCTDIASLRPSIFQLGTILNDIRVITLLLYRYKYLFRFPVFLTFKTLFKQQKCEFYRCAWQGLAWRRCITASSKVT